MSSKEKIIKIIFKAFLVFLNLFFFGAFDFKEVDQGTAIHTYTRELSEETKNLPEGELQSKSYLFSQSPESRVYMLDLEHGTAIARLL